MGVTSCSGCGQMSPHRGRRSTRWSSGVLAWSAAAAAAEQAACAPGAAAAAKLVSRCDQPSAATPQQPTPLCSWPLPGTFRQPQGSPASNTSTTSPEKRERREREKGGAIWSCKKVSLLLCPIQVALSTVAWLSWLAMAVRRRSTVVALLCLMSAWQSQMATWRSMVAALCPVSAQQSQGAAAWRSREVAWGPKAAARGPQVTA
ncbi:uncharacterized protein [Oryza sativa Japonica Group]|uniref:Expressed protein n=1 Tax=Oryza sativa subsp. japonica TaxID=39947 RepID=Q2R7Z3_ORYSJ|nr:uncharacterized protein LOC9271305 [Oryza sativa Japonica Group]ABA92376.2 expressed protein [Oryza sativa Japonica Group]KAF2910315.1 hypothetical protein DAI22_11g091600 [Oryza sativa Japonica Group]BAG99814.1 unnamed protein product [Oryza sativa Japonica Group]